MSQSQSPSPVASSAEKERFGPTQPVMHCFLTHTPLMEVVEVVRIPGSYKERKIAGIRCAWFDTVGGYQTAIFSSMNLRHAKPEELPTGYKPRVTEKQLA